MELDAVSKLGLQAPVAHNVSLNTSYGNCLPGLECCNNNTVAYKIKRTGRAICAGAVGEQFCGAGRYCPNSTTQTPCPEGHYCRVSFWLGLDLGGCCGFCGDWGGFGGHVCRARCSMCRPARTVLPCPVVMHRDAWPAHVDGCLQTEVVADARHLTLPCMTHQCPPFDLGLMGACNPMLCPPDPRRTSASRRAATPQKSATPRRSRLAPKGPR